MSSTYRRIICLLLLVTMVAALLGGCQTVSEPGEVTLIYGYGAEAVTLDPAESIDGPSFDVIHNIYDGLLEVDAEGRIVPALATDYSLADDQVTWTFTLRQGVKFHDGTEFDGEAVKYNFDRQLNEELGLANFRQWDPFIESVSVIDRYTVQIVTKGPYGSFLPKLAGSYGKFISVSPAASSERGSEFSRNPSGSGPFMLDSWVPGERLTLARNPDYWREGPSVDKVEFRVITDGSSRVMALEAGDVQLINQVPAQNLAALAAKDNLDIERRTILRLFYWAFNHTKDVWKDPQVRLALNHAIDRESIVENILFGVGEPANAFISPSVFGSVPIDVYDYDPAKAREMLEAANFPFDEELVCYVTEGRYYQDRQVAEAIQGMLAQIGVKVKVEVLEWGAFVDAIWFTVADDPVAQARDLMQTSFGNDDPPTWMRQTLHAGMWPKDGFNEAFYANAEVDRLIDEANQATDLEERSRLLGEIQRELIADPPWLISHFEQAVVAHQSTVEGLLLNIWGIVEFRNARVSN